MKRLMLGLFAVIVFSAAATGFTSDYNSIQSIYESQGGNAAGDNAIQQVPQQQPGKNTGLYDFKPKAAVTPAADNSLGEIVVTARKMAEYEGLVTKSIDIISEEKIKASGAVKLEDVLSELPGLSVLKYGSYEGLASLNIRGASSRQSLVLYEGIPLNDIFTGGVDLNLVEMSGIGRVEVIKGGMSSIYGADAAAGVVNLLKEKKKMAIADISASFGSDNFQKYSLSSDYKIGGVKYSVTGNEEKSPGYMQNSGFFKRSAGARISFSGDAIDSKLSGYYIKREEGIPFNQFGPSPLAKQFDELFAVGAEETLKFNETKVVVSGYYRGGDLAFKNPDIYVDDRHIKNEGKVSVMSSYTAGPVNVYGGYEFSNKSAKSLKTGNKSTGNHAVLTNATAYLFEKLVLTAAVREDVHSVYGMVTSFSGGARYSIADSTDVFASVSQAFSEPTFGDLFWDETLDFGGYISTTKGNQALKPEKSMSYEAGITKKEGNISEKIVLYRRDVTDMIRWVTETDWATYDKSSAENLDRAVIMGAEVEAEFVLFDFITLTGAYSYLDARDKKTGKKLSYSPEDSVYAKAEFKLPFSTKLSAGVRYIDSRLDNAGEYMKEYYIYDLSVRHIISENASVFANVDNVLDNREYQVVNKYPMQGRTINAGVNLSF
ncbi:MAG: TonB-dependent receptor [Candidatus Goldbacteria bacterium]|nr:TonB-dependent receptor [Candidatus Goldiibacteriota bacterium]